MDSHPEIMIRYGQAVSVHQYTTSLELSFYFVENLMISSSPMINSKASGGAFSQRRYTHTNESVMAGIKMREHQSVLKD